LLLVEFKDYRERFGGVYFVLHSGSSNTVNQQTQKFWTQKLFFICILGRFPSLQS